MHDFVTAREALKLDHKLEWAPRGGRSCRQSFAFGRAGPDAHGCVRQLIDMPDTDHRLRPVAVQDARQFSPSAARNCVPIREVLTRVLPKKGIVLEIGSGTGEHVVCFAKALPRLVWLPSDPDGASRTSIEAWMTSEGLTNVRAPVSIDVREKVWGVEGDAPFDGDDFHKYGPHRALEGGTRASCRRETPSEAGRGSLPIWSIHDWGEAHGNDQCHIRRRPQTAQPTLGSTRRRRQRGHVQGTRTARGRRHAGEQSLPRARQIELAVLRVDQLPLL